LAYDAVSQRFVIGDARGRKLIVVAVGSGHADDMVRADSAGFEEVAGLAIDDKRGDLWVASVGGESSDGALHRLQLVSGRPLKTYKVPASLRPTRLVGLVVQPSGAIIALDSAGSRLLSLAAGASDMTVAASLKLTAVRSIAAGDDNTMYVAYDEGIARVDLRTGTVVPVAAPKGFDLRRFETIRVHGESLLGVQTTSAGLRQLVRLNFTPTRRGIRDGAVLDQSVGSAADQLSLALAGDDLYYLAPDGSKTGTGNAAEAPPAQFVVRRLKLR
jgi:hypothetical protein